LRIFLDTSVLVASVVSHHPHHSRATSVVGGVLSGKDEGCVSAHGLAETYAVLTTLPVTPRIGPESAKKVIEDNIIAHFEVVALTARDYARLFPKLVDRGVMGGATYDVIQLACARKASAQRIYTFNVKDFRRLDPELAQHVVAP
jgi:predicted nucleic acid-binding protein